MNLAPPMQAVQDWITQQWVILGGRKISPKDHSWLMGPFGDTQGIGGAFVDRLAAREGLLVNRETSARGLVPSFHASYEGAEGLSDLPASIVAFYERTADYHFRFGVSWNPVFRIPGFLVNRLFSGRLQQLHIPTANSRNPESLSSEVLALVDPASRDVKYTVWLRTMQSTGQMVFSGIYQIGRLPDARPCVKAIFPLPNGNATVILVPRVGYRSEFVLDASGQNFGDPGFYFLFNDAKGNHWVRYVRSFRNTLIIRENAEGSLSAEHLVRLWSWRGLRMSYRIVNE